MIRRNLRALATIGALFLLTGIPGTATADGGSAAILDRYFDAIGGREIWARGHGEYVLAKVIDPRFPLPATFEFCWSWDEPKRAERMRVQGLSRRTALTADDGWMFTRPSNAAAGVLEATSAERRARSIAEWTGNFEVLTHRLAKRDAAVKTRLGEGPWQQWIQVTVDDDVVAYLLIGEDGSPKRFFRLSDEISIVFGPLADRGNVRFPAWGAFEGGEPFDIIAFEILDRAPSGPFEKPQPADAGYWSCH